MAQVYTNLWVFYDIAHEAYAQMQEIQDSLVRPKPNGEPGYILTFDRTQKSFKAALTATVFSGVYLEALLHLRLVEIYGVEDAKKYDRCLYKEKLALVGCTDQEIIEESEHYRKVRREVVHEKAHLDVESNRTAQVEAKRAVELIERVNQSLSVVRD